MADARTWEQHDESGLPGRQRVRVMAEGADQEQVADGDEQQTALVAEAREALSDLVAAIGSAKDSDWAPDLQVVLPEKVGTFSPCVAAFVEAARELSDGWSSAASLLTEMGVLFEVFRREAIARATKEAVAVLPQPAEGS